MSMPEQISPIRLFATLLLLIFCIEGATMFALDSFSPRETPVWVGACIDAGLLAVVTSLVVWRLFLRPLEFALLSETAQIDAVLDKATQGIVSFGESGVIESFNRAAEHMFACPAEEIIGKNVRILVPNPRASERDNYLAFYVHARDTPAVRPAQDTSALRQGGIDFPIELNVAEIRVGGGRRFAAIVRDVTERSAAEFRVHLLAHYDSLTGLPNRMLFYDRLERALSSAKRDGGELALLYIDLDWFERVNDSLGHGAGDELLTHVADRLRRQVRESDTVARVGGDEFALLLPVIGGRAGASQVAEKIIATLSTNFVLGNPKRKVCIGASMGIAIYPADAQQTDALLRIADAARFKAKQVRNSYRFYTE